MRMKPRLILLFLAVILLGCAHQEKEETLGTPSAGEESGAAEDSLLRWIAFMPFDAEDRGMLVIWDASSRSRSRPALKGGGDGNTLRFCSARIYNFSDEPLTLPDFGGGDLSMESAGGIHPLLPLSRFKDDFYYPGTLELMDRNLEGQLSGCTWLQTELACRVAEDGDPGPPLQLVSRSGERVPWIQIESERILKLIRTPTYEGLVNLAGPR